MTSNKLKIFVMMHKKVDLNKLNLEKNTYQKLLLGKQENVDLPEDILVDSTGDNISDKNKNFCELTGLYWIWKNTDYKYVGLCHYRRFFLNKIKTHILRENECMKILKNADIILPKSWKTEETIYEIYKKYHYSEDLDLCRNIIEKKYPEYLSYFDKLINSHQIYPLNMFVCKKELIDKYCEWIFDILFELEKQIDISSRDDHQKRVYGFLSERLFNVWIRKNNLKIESLPLFFIEQTKLQRLKANIINMRTSFKLKLKGIKL